MEGEVRLSCGGPSPHQQPRLGRPCLPRNAMVVSATKFPCFFCFEKWRCQLPKGVDGYSVCDNDIHCILTMTDGRPADVPTPYGRSSDGPDFIVPALSQLQPSVCTD